MCAEKIYRMVRNVAIEQRELDTIASNTYVWNGHGFQCKINFEQPTIDMIESYLNQKQQKAKADIRSNFIKHNSVYPFYKKEEHLDFLKANIKMHPVFYLTVFGMYYALLY